MSKIRTFRIRFFCSSLLPHNMSWEWKGLVWRTPSNLYVNFFLKSPSGHFNETCLICIGNPQWSFCSWQTTSVLIHSTHPKASSYHSVIDPVFAPTGEDPESKSVIEDDSVMVAVDPFNPSLHIKKTKGEVLKGYHNVFEGRFSKATVSYF